MYVGGSVATADPTIGCKGKVYSPRSVPMKLESNAVREERTLAHGDEIDDVSGSELVVPAGSSSGSTSAAVVVED